MVERYLIMINIILQLIKIGIGILLILGLSYILRILALIYKLSKKESDKSICDDCESLFVKNSDRRKYKYICQRYEEGFDCAPEICKMYKKKSGD